MDNTPSRLGHIPRTYSTRSEHSFISPLIEEKDYVPYRVSTSQVSERDENNHHVEKVFKNKENIVKESDESEEITSESEIDQITDHSENSENNTCPCKQGQSNSENDTQEEDYYKLISQFRDSDINVLSNNNILEFLKLIRDQELRSRIIEQIDDIPSTSNTSKALENIELITNNNPYTMTEVYKLMNREI
ncbi:hypothetical protein M9H77_13836 [Catharanthus roseus]|uniref:Uncharacterized protein n=1 Tax=Catharanthus roseus TaxID=4058 RepID=A0ACC0BLI4_CATRO|nr:hypothetical protein M9H77_13836 [Catharanthus roseus]